MRPKKNNDPQGLVQFEKHEPERRRAAGGNLFCGGGCCCCCCCLHALGGLIGAAVASRKSKVADAGPVAGTYWLFLVLAAVALIIYAGASAGSDGIGIGLVVMLLVLPALQLVASVLTLILINLRRKAFPDRKASLRALGKITLYSFLGSLIGVLLMVIGSKMFH